MALELLDPIPIPTVSHKWERRKIVECDCHTITCYIRASDIVGTFPI